MSDSAARTLLARRDAIAAAANEAFLARHPDWLERFGDKARTHGDEDARFHVDYLAAALETDRPELFRDYLRWTARVLESRGMRAADLHEHVRDVVEASKARLDDAAARTRVEELAAQALREAEERAAPPGPDGPGAAARLYTEAALRGDRKAAFTIVEEELRAGADVRDVYVDVLQASQVEIGRRWESNRISVAQEHMATAVTQTVLTLLYGRLPVPEKSRGRAVVTGVEGELHQVGARMVADFLEADGWDVRFLGSHMPHQGVLELIESERPALVGISATITARLPAVRALIDDLARRLGPDRPPVLVGGGAFHAGGADLAQSLGADHHGRDLHEAITLARAWSA